MDLRKEERSRRYRHARQRQGKGGNVIETAGMSRGRGGVEKWVAVKETSSVKTEMAGRDQKAEAAEGGTGVGFWGQAEARGEDKYEGNCR